MKTYKIYTLGCKVNQYDSGRLAAEFKRAGLAMARNGANVAIINSCAVTKTAMIKSGRMIRLAKKENPKAKIVLAGCWPKAEKIKNKIAGVDLIYEAGDYKKLVKQIFGQYRKQPEIASPLIDSGLAMTDKGRYFIKIQDGCEQYCTYCIIPYTRGKLKSRAESEVIAEIKQAVKTGYGEIVLSGIHLGLYGKTSQLSLRGANNYLSFRLNPALDAGAGRNPLNSKLFPLSDSSLTLGMTDSTVARNGNLADLIKKLIKIKNLGRLRLSSIEITEVTDEMIKLMAKSKKICPHLHIPLQSGSDKILKLMNRPYTIKNYKLRIKNIRKVVPDIAITTDVIVGFPGETEKDFRETEKFIKQIKFSRLHIFPFSAHAKTPAAKFPGQVAEKIKARRAKILRRLGVKLAEDYRKKFKSKELELAVEQIMPDKIIGKSEYYFDVEISQKKMKNKNLKIGEIIKVKY